MAISLSHGRMRPVWNLDDKSARKYSAGANRTRVAWVSIWQNPLFFALCWSGRTQRSAITMNIRHAVILLIPGQGSPHSRLVQIQNLWLSNF